MPYRQKGSKYWWISYSVCGRQVRESSRTTVFRDAKALEQEKRSESAKQRHTDARFSFDALMERYLDEIEGELRHDRSIHAAKALYDHFSGLSMEDVTQADIHAYRASRKGEGRKDSTIIKELRVLSAAINHSRDWGWKLDNPVRRLSKPEGRLRWITRDQAMTLIAAARRSTKAPYLADLITLALSTGMRRGELLGLTWDRVDLARRLVYLRPHDQKGRRHSSVPLNQTAIEALRRHIGEGEYVFVYYGEPIKSVKRSFATACRRAKIDDFHFHDLRHTCAAWLVQAGTPIRTVAEILRHRDIQTTMRYAHLAPENAREAVEGIKL